MKGTLMFRRHLEIYIYFFQCMCCLGRKKIYITTHLLHARQECVQGLEGQTEAVRCGHLWKNDPHIELPNE